MATKPLTNKPRKRAGTRTSQHSSGGSGISKIAVDGTADMIDIVSSQQARGSGFDDDDDDFEVHDASKRRSRVSKRHSADDLDSFQYGR